MSTNKLPIHGRDHRLGGADPIPFPQTAVLDYLWITGGSAAVIAAKYLDFASITTVASTSTGFTTVTDTINFGDGQPYTGTVIQAPAGDYLASTHLAVDTAAPYTSAVNAAWRYKFIAKQSVAGWNHEAIPVWGVDAWRIPSTGGYDPTIIPQDLSGFSPITINDLGSGLGLFSILVLNDDSSVHHYAAGHVVLVNLTLGTTGDAYH